MQTLQRNNGWREYQRTLKKNSSSKKRSKIVKKYLPFFPLIIPIVVGMFITFNSFAYRIDISGPPEEKIQSKPQEPALNKKEIQNIFSDTTFLNLQDKQFQFATGGKIISVDTSIDIDLQKYMISQFEKLHHLNRGKPRHLAVVAIEPTTGRILCMASFDKNSSKINHCISHNFPAASIFKIVTATAAIETCGLTPESKLEYNGGKYTLYKSQLKNRRNKYTNRVTFKKSFAESINPVFGKIGANMLGKDTLEEYAYSFGFNKKIDFEIPLEESHFEISEKPYNWAELACGFNRNTVVSPLHCALLSASIINYGQFTEPSIVDRIYDDTGKVLYSNKTNIIQSTVSPDASIYLKSLMASTIKSGTAKKAFRGLKRDPILSQLNIGGKTGSISNKKRDVKYDWFVGYAEEKNGSKQMAISIVVGHEKYLGTRACKYARMAIKEYFKNDLVTNKDRIRSNRKS